MNLRYAYRRPYSTHFGVADSDKVDKRKRAYLGLMIEKKCKSKYLLITISKVYESIEVMICTSRLSLMVMSIFDTITSVFSENEEIGNEMLANLGDASKW